MKSKTFMTMIAAAAGAALLAGAAIPAQAAREINIYGASAQYLFWNELAPNFLTSKGCTGVNVAHFDGTGSTDPEYHKHGIARGTACTQYGGDDVIIRYSSKASFDGIFALTGAPLTGMSGDPDGCGSNFQRRMADEATISSGVVGGRKCVIVNVGASDVAGESFTQQSHGNKLGPAGGVWQDKVFTPVSTTGLAFERPVVVPFGFFVNNNVTVTRCGGGTNPAGLAANGEMCYVDTSVTPNVTYGCAGDATCQAPAILDNITREMAVNIFSGSVFSWTDFGSGFPADLPIVACMRHAGSGTHATLDYAVMKGGANLYANQSASAPTVWFNDGSTDEMNCVRGQQGGIGYADADQAPGTGVTALKYNGLYGTRVNIRNGMYDFWSNQWMYTNLPSSGNLARVVYNNMMTYASNPSNIPAGKVRFWATSGEMNYGKSSDKAYPTYVGATDPRLP